jgi:S-adenosylmethionine:tRNA ribosyltransferase-isomerase
MKTSDFDYVLPPERIAQTPVEPRDHARLLVLERATGAIHHRHCYDLPEYLRPGDVLVLNDTRVLRARLRGRKETGGRVELLLLRRREPGLWEALVGGRGLKPGRRLLLTAAADRTVEATIVAELPDGQRLVQLDPALEAHLEEWGEMPLPPYIHTPPADPERYQTVFARRLGSVAAPTAGLHFTPELLLRLREQGVQIAYITLHVGLDTFRPVQTEDPQEHKLHREWLEVSAETARIVNETRLHGGRIVAVGTTCVRALETAAKAALGLAPNEPVPDDRACGWQTIVAWSGETDLFILPGHRFRAVDALMTNFHLPRSTLLMLVAAFAGRERTLNAYHEAIAQGYRFYSFGDAMLIL